MSTETYLGNPPSHIAEWIISHSQPETRAETRVWWSSDESDYDDYLIEGTIGANSLDAYGKSWSNAYKVEIGIGSQENPLTTIDDETFSQCYNLTNITISNSIININYSAFYGCSNLTTLIIPNSVTNIGSSAFSNCSSLTSIVMSDNIVSIGDYAFDSCQNLTSVTIGDNVTTIGEDAFSGCTSLTSVIFQGKTLNQVQQMDNYSWGISDTSIISVA